MTRLADLSTNDLVHLLLDMVHRWVLHHGLWYTEVRHQMGTERALELIQRQTARSVPIQVKRLSKVLGIPLTDGLPEPLAAMPREALLAIAEAIAANWLANDGVWFQTVETDSGMNDAKRCNDSCWAHFSPFEAESIRSYLQLGDRPGLDGLKSALGFRMYSLINVQSIAEETPESFVFQMNECRVQAARNRKGLADYPCKSAGMVEYTYFARALDPRIRTECIGCPPDDHPDDWYCAWRFTLADPA